MLRLPVISRSAVLRLSDPAFARMLMDMIFVAELGSPIGPNLEERHTVRESPIHGLGLFAGSDIVDGEPILDYPGLVFDSPRSRYSFFHGNYRQFLDPGDEPWAASHRVNHSHRPNLIALDFYIEFFM